MSLFNSNNTQSPDIFDTTGNYRLNPNACSSAMTLNGDGTVNTQTLTDPVLNVSLRRTYTYDGSRNVTSYTGWVKV